MQQIQASEEFQQTMDLQTSKLENQQVEGEQKTQIEREKIEAQMKLKEMDVQIAERNKNRFDKPQQKKPAAKKK